MPFDAEPFSRHSEARYISIPIATRSRKVSAQNGRVPPDRQGATMKTMKKISLLLLLAASAAFAGPALAHGNVRFGVSIGVPLWGPGYYYPPYYQPYPYYYPPATMVVPSQPQRYIEQPRASAAAVWYYCADARAYYPYVKDCPGGWQRVSPTPR